MGFRCTLTTTDFSPARGWPDWFRDKYGEILHIPEIGGPLSTKFEAKHYGILYDLPEDIRKCVDWDGQEKFTCPVAMVILYECGSIARYDIRRDRIRVWEVEDVYGWQEVDDPTHLEYNHCHSCIPEPEQTGRGQVGHDGYSASASGRASGIASGASRDLAAGGVAEPADSRRNVARQLSGGR